ncbi:MAG: hypothetical protein ACXWC0_19135, partial [Burkholderiales bacterium]
IHRSLSASLFHRRLEARTPKPVIDKLNGDIARVVQLPEVREQLAREGSEPASARPSSSENTWRTKSSGSEKS